MIHRPLIRLGAVAAVVPLLALGPAAHAEKWVAKDKRGDVTLGSYSDNLLHPAPKAATADITRTVVAHRAEHLVVRVKVRHLFRDEYSLATRIRTPDGKYWVTFHMLSGKGPGKGTGPDGKFVFYRGKKGPDCVDPRHTLSKRNVVKLRIPRTCLGDPTWVRVGARFDSSDKPRKYFYMDQAHPKVDSAAGYVRLGPRVRVG